MDKLGMRIMFAKLAQVQLYNKHFVTESVAPFESKRCYQRYESAFISARQKLEPRESTTSLEPLSSLFLLFYICWRVLKNLRLGKNSNQSKTCSIDMGDSPGRKISKCISFFFCVCVFFYLFKFGLLLCSLRVGVRVNPYQTSILERAYLSPGSTSPMG